MDQFTASERSAIMRRVKGSGNISTEARLIAVLRANGLTGWRRGSRLPGQPDLIFPKAKLALFVHGCFWHGHACKRGRNLPASNSSYWNQKLARNARRDNRVRRELRARGWATQVVWECVLSKRARVIADRIAARLTAGRRDRP